MSTTRAAGFAFAGLGLAVALGLVGGVAIYHTKDGQVQGSDVPEDQFPSTPTGALGVVDDAGRLGSVIVFAVRPDPDPTVYDPAGGSIVPVPASADASGGFGAERMPLDESVDLEGSSILVDEVPALLGVSVDDTTVLTVDELAAALAPLGDISVALPGGTEALDAAAIAAALGPDPQVPASSAYATQVAVWRAIAAAVGDGLGEPLQLPGDAAASFRWLTAGPIGVTSLHADLINDLGVNPRGVDAVALDRAEVVTLFGHVAPSRVAAPNLGPNFLLRSGFADDQLPAGLSRYDVAYAATAALLAAENNVVSVDTTAGSAAEVTLVEVADPLLAEDAQGLADIFGPVEVRVGSRRIVGIDVVVTLGTGYLAEVAEGSSPATTASTSPSTPGTTSE